MAAPVQQQVWERKELTHSAENSRYKAKRDARLSLQVTRPLSPQSENWVSPTSPSHSRSPPPLPHSHSTNNVHTAHTSPHSPHTSPYTPSHNFLSSSLSSLSSGLTSTPIPISPPSHLPLHVSADGVKSASTESANSIQFLLSNQISNGTPSNSTSSTSSTPSSPPSGRLTSSPGSPPSPQNNPLNSLLHQSLDLPKVLQCEQETITTKSTTKSTTTTPPPLPLPPITAAAAAAADSSSLDFNELILALRIMLSEEQSKSKALQKSLDSSQLELKATHQNLNNYKQRMTDLQKTLGTAREAVALTKNETDSIEQQLKNSKKELETLQQTHFSTLRALEISQQSLLTFSEQKETLESKYDMLQQQLERTSQELTVMQNRFKVSEEKREVLQKSFENAHTQLNSANDDIKQLTAERGNLLLLLQAANQRTSDVQKNLEDAQQQIAILNSENTTLLSATQGAQKSFAMLQKQWEDARQVIDNLTAQNSHLLFKVENQYLGTVDFNKTSGDESLNLGENVLCDSLAFHMHVSGIRDTDTVGAICLSSNHSESVFVWDGNDAPCGGIMCRGNLFDINLLWEGTQYHKVIFVLINKEIGNRTGALDMYGTASKGRYLFSTNQQITALAEIYLDADHWKLKTHGIPFKDTIQFHQWLKDTNGCELVQSFYTAFQQQRITNKKTNSPSRDLTSSSPKSNFVRYTKNPHSPSDDISIAQSRVSRQIGRQDFLSHKCSTK